MKLISVISLCLTISVTIASASTLTEQIDSYLAVNPACTWLDACKTAERLAQHLPPDSAGIVVEIADSVVLMRGVAVRLLVGESDKLRSAKQFDSALVVCRKAHNSFVKVYGRQQCESRDTLSHLDIPCMIENDILLRIGDLFVFKRNLDSASIYLEHVIHSSRRIRDKVTLGNGLFTLQRVYNWMGRLDDQLRLLSEVLSLDSTVYDSAHISYLEDYSALSTANRELGRYQDAMRFHNESFAMIAKLGLHATAREQEEYQSAAITCRRTGDYATCFAFLDSAEALVNKLYPRDSIKLLTIFSIKANALRDVGMNVEAEALYQQASRIIEQSGVIDSVVYSQHLDGFGLFLNEMKKYDQAAPMLSKSLDIRMHLYGTSSYQVALSLNNLGLAVEGLGHDDSALELYSRSLMIREATFGKKSVVFVRCLSNMCEILQRNGNSDSALSVFHLADSIYTILLGEYHSERGSLLLRFSRLAWLSGDTARSLDLLLQACKVKRVVISNCVQMMNARQATIAANDLKACLTELSIKFFRTDRSSQLESRVIEELLKSQGLASSEVTQRFNRIRSQISLPSDSAMLEDLGKTRNRIASMVTRTESNTISPRQKEILDSLVQYADKVELALSVKTHLAGRDAVNRSVEKELQDKLPDNSSIVAFLLLDGSQVLSTSRLVTRVTNDTQAPELNDQWWLKKTYVAIVIDKVKQARLVELATQDELDPLIHIYSDEIRRYQKLTLPLSESDQDLFWQTNDKIVTRLWNPLKEYIGRCDRIAISVDGELGLLSFAGMRDMDSQYLGEKYVFSYAGVPRDLLTNADNPSKGKGLLAMGDPNFDWQDQRNYKSTSSDVQSANVAGTAGVGGSYDVRNSSKTTIGQTLSRLPQTRIEIESNIQTWKASSADTVECFLGNEATEERFKQSAPGKQVIYVATHGIYNERACSSVAFGDSLSFVDSLFCAEPLFGCGVALAGYNVFTSATAAAEHEDGFLSGSEVQSMDLSSVSIVVLSACGTERGTAIHGESIQSLSRTFRQAGARTVIGTIWPIDDVMTSRLMSSLIGGTNEDGARLLANKQREFISSLRKKGENCVHPMSWASFVVNGPLIK